MLKLFEEIEIPPCSFPGVFILFLVFTQSQETQNKDNRHSGHVDVQNKRNYQNYFVKSTSTWPPWRQMKTGYRKWAYTTKLCLEKAIGLWTVTSYLVTRKDCVNNLAVFIVWIFIGCRSRKYHCVQASQLGK